MGNNGSCCCEDTNTAWQPVPQRDLKNYVEDFVIIWLNPSHEQDPTQTKEIKEELQKHVNLVVMCTHTDQCNQFIGGVEDQKLFVIVSASSPKKAISLAPTSPKIDSIYYLNTKTAVKTSSIRRGNEVIEQFNNVKDLGKQLKQDIKRCEAYFVKPQIIDTNPDKIRFFYDQLIQGIMLTSKEDKMDDIVHFWRKSYAENPLELKTINEFEQTYSKVSAINWYTKQCGLYKTTNTALRRRNYENLYDSHVFIRHLHDQIVFHSKQHAFDGQTFYRGQSMDIKEFNRIEKPQGKFLFFPYFMSTSIDRKVAMNFARHSVKPNEEQQLVKVLFEINIDDDVSFPYAYVKELSEYKEEEECLFSMGSTYRVNHMETTFCDEKDKFSQKPIRHEIKVIRMTLIDDKDEQLIALKEHWTNLLKDESTSMNFARVLYQKGDLELSKIFYEKVLQKEEGKCDRQAAVHNNLGSIAFTNQQYEEALEHYEQSIELEMENTNSQNLVLAYQNIATVYYKTRDMVSAIEHLQKAIHLHNNSPNDWNIRASIHNNMAQILNSQGKHDAALQNNKKCLRIRQRTLPSIHPDLAIAFNSMAVTFHHLRRSIETEDNSDEANEYGQKALDYAVKAVNIDRQSLPPDHPQSVNHDKNFKYLQN